MESIPKGRYTREFRQEAVKLVVEERVSCREAAQRLSLALRRLLTGSRPIKKASWEILGVYTF